MCVQADAVHAHWRATVRRYAPQAVTARTVGSENEFPAVRGPDYSIHPTIIESDLPGFTAGCRHHEEFRCVVSVANESYHLSVR